MPFVLFPCVPALVIHNLDPLALQAVSDGSKEQLKMMATGQLDDLTPVSVVIWPGLIQ